MAQRVYFPFQDTQHYFLFNVLVSPSDDSVHRLPYDFTLCSTSANTSTTLVFNNFSFFFSFRSFVPCSLNLNTMHQKIIIIIWSTLNIETVTESGCCVSLTFRNCIMINSFVLKNIMIFLWLMSHGTCKLFVSLPQMASYSSIHIFFFLKENQWKKKQYNRIKEANNMKIILIIIMNNKMMGNGFNVPKRKYIQTTNQSEA